MIELMDHQKKAVEELENGNILWGGTGDGKSVTALAYYMKNECPKDIYIITTAKKRDSGDWQHEAIKFGLSEDFFIEEEGYKKYWGILTVDSWNNIGNYLDVENAFFIFDEQRVVGTGSWVKSFIKIAKKNNWILLSATPGDTWLDYAPVFIANGFYKNITDFKTKHVIYEPFRKFPVVQGYLNETKLELLRNHILVEMQFEKHTERMMNWIDVGYDFDKFKRVYKDRWHIYEDRPLKDVSELFRVMRKLVNSDPSRLEIIKKLLTCHDRLIIYYNFDYELEILRTLHDHIPVYEWNGHKKDHNATFEHEPRWVYLVQFVAGAEAWNCTATDAMVLYSLTYSYKNFQQVLGRIDRLNTPYTILYYYILVSNSIVCRAIRKSLDLKKSFNERKFIRENVGPSGEFQEADQIRQI